MLSSVGIRYAVSTHGSSCGSSSGAMVTVLVGVSKSSLTGSGYDGGGNSQQWQ